MQRTTPKPVEPIPPTPPCDEKVVYKLGHAGRVLEIEVVLSREPIDTEQYPGWLGVETSLGHIAARVLS